MYRTSTHNPTIVVYIRYITRYILVQIYSGNSITCTQQTAYWKLKGIKTSQRHQVKMDDSYINYLLVEDMYTGEDNKNGTEEVAPILKGLDHFKESPSPVGMCYILKVTHTHLPDKGSQAISEEQLINGCIDHI